jgi:hypothetical protein
LGAIVTALTITTSGWLSAPAFVSVSETMMILFLGSIVAAFAVSFIFSYVFGSIRATIFFLIVLAMTILGVSISKGYAAAIGVLAAICAVPIALACIGGTVTGIVLFDKRNGSGANRN